MNSLFAVALAVLLGTAYAQYNQSQVNTNDLNVLQYALTLENLESTFYAQGQSTFSSSDFTAAGLTAADYAYLGVIAAHEAAHVTFLSSAITTLGGTPVTPCSYQFGTPSPFSSVKAYIAYALVLENTGVSAYDGAINLITSRDYIEAAATVATIEGRHAQYLYNLNATLGNLSPAFPNGAFEPVLTPSQVAAAIPTILNGCQNKISLPIDTFVSANTKFTSASGTTVTTDAVNANDLNTLQYALYLEHLEAAFYNKYQTQYSSSDFTSAGYNSSAYTYLTLIQAHENAHVTALSSAITTLGGTPITACNYDFSALVTSVQSYVNLAAMLEPVGTAAYDGAANSVTSRSYIQVAATIATIEARHAAILAVIADQVSPGMYSPFFNRTEFLEPALTPTQVVAMVTGLNVVQASSPSTCQIGTSSIPLPVVYTETVQTTTTTTTTAPNSNGASVVAVSALLTFAVAAALLM